MMRQPKQTVLRSSRSGTDGDFYLGSIGLDVASVNRAARRALWTSTTTMSHMEIVAFLGHQASTDDFVLCVPLGLWGTGVKYALPGRNQYGTSQSVPLLRHGTLGIPTPLDAYVATSWYECQCIRQDAVLTLFGETARNPRCLLVAGFQLPGPVP